MRSAVEQLRSDVPGYKQGGRVSFDGIQEKTPAILAFLERLANIELKLYPADFPQTCGQYCDTKTQDSQRGEGHILDA